MKNKLFIGIFISGAVLFYFVYLTYFSSGFSSGNHKQKPETIQLNPLKLQSISIAALPHSYTGYSVFVAREKNLFQKYGLNAEIILKYNSGKEAIDAMLKGQSDFAVSSETPFMHSVLNGQDVCILAVMITAYNHLGIVARKDANIQLPVDLSGKRIGVTKGSNGEYFLDMALKFYNIDRKSIAIVYLTPEQMCDSILQARVDAIATWNPVKMNSLRNLGSNGIQFYPENVYSPHFILVSKRKWAEENPDIIKKTLAALNEASLFIQKNQKDSFNIVSPYLKTDIDTLNAITSSYDFKLQLNQDILHSLENQVIWIFERNKIKKILPNFLNHISTGGLKETIPENVKLIIPEKNNMGK